MVIKLTSNSDTMADSSTSASASSTHTLSFPAQTFAKLAPIPFLHAHLTHATGPHRPSGRKPSECRPPTLHTGSLSHASGSAVVRIGDTAVVCGIRAEILNTKDVADWKHPAITPRSADSVAQERHEDAGARRKRRKVEADEIARLNLLVPNVELSTGCSPAHLPGSPPSDLAQTLSHRVLSLLHTTQLLEAEDLRIWHHLSNASPSRQQDSPSTAPNPDDPSTVTREEDLDAVEISKPQIKAYWTLHITMLFLSLDGNPFDAAWCSLLAALQDTRLPRAWWDPDLESVLCSPEVAEATRLSLNGLPIPLTVGVFTKGDCESAERARGEKWLLADMDGFEEGCVRETVCLVVKGEGKGAELVRLEKSGGGLIGREEIRELVEVAGRRWREWRNLLGGIRSGEDVEMAG